MQRLLLVKDEVGGAGLLGRRAVLTVGRGRCLLGVELNGDGGTESGVAGGGFAGDVLSDLLLGLEESVQVLGRLLNDAG